MRQQRIALNAPGDGALLVFAQFEFPAVDHRCSARIDLESRRVVLLQNVVVEKAVVDLLHLLREFRVVHHEIVKAVQDLILILAGGQRRLLVDDLVIVASLRIPDPVFDDWVLQIQDLLQQRDCVQILHIVLIQKSAILIVRFHRPLVLLLIVLDLDRRGQILRHPFLYDVGGQPERSERKVDVFDGERLRQHAFQRFDIRGQSG